MTIMTMVADSFLEDLHQLSDNEADDVPLEQPAALNYYEDNGPISTNLQKTMQKIQDALDKGIAVSLLEDDPEYQLVAQGNSLCVDIDNEIGIIHDFVRHNYRLKFPELESLVLHPVDYVRVVKKIGNEVDLTLIDLKGILPSAIIMVLSVTASTTDGKPLPEDVLRNIINACDRALDLDFAKKKILHFVEDRMGFIAPNLSAIVGGEVAAKLMGAAGGLAALSRVPACNFILIGAQKEHLSGFSTATSHFHVGYIAQTEIFQSTPPPLRTRACRLLAAKATLAARVDSMRTDPIGSEGRSLREMIIKKIENWQEMPPAKQPKRLPVPDFKPKKKRGGVRFRKTKERYGMTNLRKLVNRVQFGVMPEESSLGDGLGEGYGMLNGRLRIPVCKKFKGKRNF